MLDLLVAGGTVVDGTGAPPVRTDIGVRDGRVVSIGSNDEEATETVDASGMTVCPGFVDVHTHFDAQAFWDPFLTPSSLYGVTTVIGGNCGFSIAPLNEFSGDYVMRMLARVEGMPLESLSTGVPWNWRTTADYLSLLEGHLGINAGFMVGHSAIRRLVMGPDSTTRASTVEELAQMQSLLSDGLAAGGMGFSTSYSPAHQDGEGVPVPSRHADEDELVTLAKVCSRFPGTSLEFIPYSAPGLDEKSISLLIAMSREAKRPINWNMLRVDANNLEQALTDLEAGSRARQSGASVVALIMPMKSRGRFSFYTAFVLDGLPGWGPIMGLPVGERLAALWDPQIRQQLAAGAREAAGGLRHLVDWGAKVIAECFSPETRRYEGRLVADIAAEEGKDPFDALLDIVCKDELRATFSLGYSTMSLADWEAAICVCRDSRAVVGASDAGAHLDFTGNFDYGVYLIEHAVREHGLIGIEEAVRLLTDVPARFYGLNGRGRLTPGFFADMVIFDHERVASGPLHTRVDLPGGAGRLYSEPVGIESVYVNGCPAVIAGNTTSELPGKVLRSGVDTRTPEMV